MKIFYLIQGTFNSGGMERVLSIKATHLARAGHDVTVVTTDQRGREPFFGFDPHVRQLDLGVDISDVESMSLLRKSLTYLIRLRRYRARLSRLLAAERPDITVSMFCSEVHFLPRLRDGSRKVVEIHFSKLFRSQQGHSGLHRRINGFRSRADERAVARYDRFVVLTDEDRELWGDLPNITVIPNPVPFFPDRPAPLVTRNAIAVGRLSYQKGYERMIAAWEIVHRRHPGWRLDIFGGGPDRKKLIERIGAAGLDLTVTLHPPTPQIADKYRAAAFSVLSSRFEGLPMVLLESMACGVPAVAFTCHCGPRDIITDGADGLLAPEGDVEALAAGIIRLIEDPALRKKMGRAARRTVASRFSESVVMRRWEELFETLTTQDK